MRIFITGATGYIGKAVAKAFRFRGHEVYGLIRSHSEPLLEVNEVIPIHGSIDQILSFDFLLNKMDAFIHCAFERSPEGIIKDASLIDQIMTLSHPFTFIYTSGVWIYGSSDSILDENSPCNPPNFVKWRGVHESKVLDNPSSNIKKMVFRPGCVFGGSGGLTDIFFKQLHAPEFEIIGSGQNHWPMIHVDDLAQAYVKAVESPLDREILNVCDESQFTVKHMAEACIQLGKGQQKMRFLSEDESFQKFGVLTEGLLLDQRVSSQKIRKALQWKPVHKNFLADLEVYFKAWQNSK